MLPWIYGKIFPIQELILSRTLLLIIMMFDNFFSSPKIFDQRNNTQSWLNISIDAALGCRANVFHIVRHAGKKSERQGNIIAIHPQAAPTVCRY